MILVGSQRGGARQLAAHLLNDRDNDHVTLLELRGFMADDLQGAMDETRAIAKGTRCTQFLFSLSLNPPKDGNASLDDLTAAADRAEEALGLTGQPRAIVVHEKQGRRHAHVVWSRIDADQMKAVPMPFFAYRLRDLSKDLYLEHGWELPEGHKTNGWRSPLNFNLAEWQQAKRLGLDPREIKQLFQSALAASDGLLSFKNALEENGYFLAKGDRRGHVAVDVHGEVFAIARWAGLKTKEVRERLGEPDSLPSVEAVKETIQRRMKDRWRALIAESRTEQKVAREPLHAERQKMVAAQRDERQRLAAGQRARLAAETRVRAARLQGGVRGAWQLLTGQTFAIRRENEAEAYRGYIRDRQQREALFRAHAKERAALQLRIDALHTRQRQERLRTARRVADLLRLDTLVQRDRDVAAQRTQRPRNYDLGM